MTVIIGNPLRKESRKIEKLFETINDKNDKNTN